MNGNEYSIGRCISILHRYSHSYISRKLEPYNIGRGQYIFLITLYKKDGISQEGISSYLKIDKATTAKTIKRLEEEGYIIRDVDSEDKRAYKVYLTQKALDVKPYIYDAIADWGNIISYGLSEDEKDTVQRLLKRMAENASAGLEEDEVKIN